MLKMKGRRSLRIALSSFIFLFLIEEIRCQECGWAPAVMAYLGDGEATQGSWPWLAAIMQVKSGNTSHLCSGSLITQRHVLTSANCFNSSNPSQYTVRIGHVDENLAEEYSIDRIDIPDTYLNGCFDNDIAILFLTRDTNPEKSSPICLPPSDEFANLTGKNVAVAGWGPTESYGPPYPKARELYGLEVISNSKCDGIFRKQFEDFSDLFPSGLTGGMICTAFPGGCIGDPGSPLMVQKENRWYVVGLSSFGMPCSADFPKSYTKVSQHFTWIHEITRPLTYRTDIKSCGLFKESQDLGEGIQRARQGAWPWVVEIQRREKNENFRVFCEGTMVTRRHVISVAHCFETHSNPSRYKVKIGHVNRSQAIDFRINRIVVPETYLKGRLYDDIALVTLEKDVENVNFSPICLPPSSKFDKLAGKEVTIVGWGSSEPAGLRTMALRQLQGVQVISSDKCAEELSSKVPTYRRDFDQGITKGIVCAKSMEGGKDICGGGEPMMYLKEDQWYLVGISSFGVSCSAGYPSGYTRVTEYLDWIQRNIRNE